MRQKPLPILTTIKDAVMLFCKILSDLDIASFDFANRDNYMVFNSAMFTLETLNQQYFYFIKDLICLNNLHHKLVQLMEVPDNTF